MLYWLRRLWANFLHDAGNFAIEAWQPCAASRHGRKCLELVLRLYVDQLLPECSGGLSDEELFGNADGENGGIGFPDSFQRLVQSHAAEGVDAGSQHQNGFSLPFFTSLMRSRTSEMASKIFDSLIKDKGSKGWTNPARARCDRA